MVYLNRFQAELLLLAVAAIWGTSYGFTKEALLYVSVPVFLALRFLLTFILLSPAIWQSLKQGLARDLIPAISTGLILFSIFLAEVYGVAQTSAANAAFLISLFILFTPLLEWLVYQRSPGQRLFILALACLVGVYLLTQNPSKPFTWQLNLGDALMIVAAFLRSIMGIATKKLMQGRSLSSLSLTAVQAGVVGLGALIIGLWQSNQLAIPSLENSHFWLILLYLVLFCTIFAFFAMNYGLKHTTPTRVALLTGSEPAFGALFAVLYLGEHLVWYQWLGGLLIVAAALYSVLPEKVVASSPKSCSSTT
jgi:drug/metabolite transporter (DMT)-like permease